MKKVSLCVVLLCSMVAGICWAQEDRKVCVLDGFEGPIVAGETIDVVSDNGSSVTAEADTVLKHDGQQSLKITYDAVSGGSIWVVPRAWRAESAKIPWENYGAISFYMKGEGKKAKIALDITDAGGEVFRFIATDEATGWNLVVCPFSQFSSFGDGTLDFPITSFQFEPLAVARGTVNIDDVSLEPLN